MLDSKVITFVVVGLIALFLAWQLMRLQEFLWRKTKGIDVKKVSCSVQQIALSSAEQVERAASSQELADFMTSTKGFLSRNWSFYGRVSRGRYIFQSLAVALVFGFIVFAGKDLYEHGFGATRKTIGFILMLPVFPWLWHVWAINTRRMRDTGVNPWWVLALLVPPVNLAAVVFLLAVPSDEFSEDGKRRST